MTSSIPTLFVSNIILNEAEILINKDTGISIKDGIELLLTNGVSIPQNNYINVGILLQQGLTRLSSLPYDTLDINTNANINEIRKAYKKMALKYHPDKNPATTPLFHVIHSAYEKLMTRAENSGNSTNSTSFENQSKKQAPSSAKSPTKPMPTKNNESSSSSSSSSTSNNNSNTNQNEFNYDQYQYKYRYTKSFPNSYSSTNSNTNNNTNSNTNSTNSKGNDQNKTNSQSKWADSRSTMAGDNDPLPGQNTYEGFRGYSAYPKERSDIPSSSSTSTSTKSSSTTKSTSTKKMEEKKSNTQRRNSAPTQSTSETPQEQMKRESEERAKRRDSEYEAAAKRIAERKARQQQRKKKDEENESKYINETLNSKSSSKQNFKNKSNNNNHTNNNNTNTSSESFELPIPIGVKVVLLNEIKNAVDIEWEKYTSSLNSKLKIELSWRYLPIESKQSNKKWKTGQSLNENDIQESSDWISSSQLISARIVRKKNLISGKKYEFRLRYVLENEVNELKKGEWCEKVSINIPDLDTLNQEKNTYVNPNSNVSNTLNRNYNIKISQLKAKNLHSKTFFMISNPYIALTIEDIRQKTTVQKNTNNPIWLNEEISFDGVNIKQQILHLEIFDKELISRKSLLGEIYIPLNELEYSNELESWMILTGGSSEDSDEISQVYIKIKGMKKSQEFENIEIKQTKNNINEKTVSSKTKSTLETNRNINSSKSNEKVKQKDKDIPNEEFNETGFLFKDDISRNEDSNMIYYLKLIPPSLSNIKIFYYSVYSNHDINSEIVGYLTPLKFVKVYERNNNWIKVDCHYNISNKNKLLTTSLIGWCQRSQWNSTTQSDYTYFQTINLEYDNIDDISIEINDTKSESESDNESDSDSDSSNLSESDLMDKIETYYQLLDENTGCFYYYNEETGESNWEPPEWIEEFDPISGSRYYAKLDPVDAIPIETTWSKPKVFSRFVRYNFSDENNNIS